MRRQHYSLSEQNHLTLRAPMSRSLAEPVQSNVPDQYVDKDKRRTEIRAGVCGQSIPTATLEIIHPSMRVATPFGSKTGKG